MLVLLFLPLTYSLLSPSLSPLYRPIFILRHFPTRHPRHQTSFVDLDHHRVLSFAGGFHVSRLICIVVSPPQYR
ncbi:hypothetical protein JAAARDRAFT_35365 [Jaapia argillacea MUCL 33604]|uniref:Uncharacterized protein n=1 Tax=Jaapia argillacea MUCL 33604 TaxID=933084 RepID=A0A067PSF6_9AGAM|nr:hypothetical protein JAAARDRAFT_35365 [Jaapia argillacea MUCL 33604]